MNTIIDREDEFKHLLNKLDIDFIQSTKHISFYAHDELVNIEKKSFLDNSITFTTTAKSMIDFNIQTNFFLEDWTDNMTDADFETFLEAWNLIEWENL